MTDDIIAHLLPFIHDETRMPAGLVKTVIEEIEQLREKVQDLRAYAEQDACEIERLRAEVARLGSFLHPIGAVIQGKTVRGD